ncbi:MAG: AAA family ATPase [Patescibacteria group bacterium]
MLNDLKIIGHKNILKYLSGIVESGSLNHAYLFSGAVGLGKTRVVKNFIASIMQQNEFDQNNSDVKWVALLEEKKDILIEQIQELQRFLALSTFNNGHKIVVIDEADKMNKEAVNCLLKILEEPPKNVILILITSAEDRLLKTIISRCQKISFLPISKKELTDGLITIFGEKDLSKIDLVAKLSQGKPELAIQLMQDDKFFAQYQKETQQLTSFVLDDINDRMKLATKVLDKKSFNESREVVDEILDKLSLIFHDILSLKLGVEEYVVGSFAHEEFNRLVQKYNLAKLKEVFTKITEAKKNLSVSVTPKMVLQNLVINL